ncbi:unnamed protein product, partial [Didymodactylos carnosus]
MVIKTLPVPQPAGALQKKSSQQSVSGPPLIHNESERKLPDAADLRRMCIITKTDLDRIYDNLTRRQREKESVMTDYLRKKELSEKSALVTKNWPNSIIGARERKIELKKIREQEDEERKKKLDIEEEKLAADRRKEQIEKAKQLRYYETDKVKTFHGALLLGEVLKERDLQIEMKKRIEQSKQLDEAETRKQYEEAQRDFYKLEAEKTEKKARERQQLAEYHMA